MGQRGRDVPIRPRSPGAFLCRGPALALECGMIASIVRGSTAGMVATVVMTAVMLAGKAAGFLHTPPPKEISGRAGMKAGVHPRSVRESHFNLAWLAAHLGFGAGCGVLFSIVRPLLPSGNGRAGGLFGGLIWAVSYLKLMPELGLYPW